MSRPTLAASSKRLRLSVSSRFASTSALPPRTSRSNPDDLYDIKNIQKFEFDDTTSVGHLWLEQERERLALLRAIEQDRSVLEQQRKAFIPPSPTQILRFKSIIHLTESSHPLSRKRVLTVPVSSLPLKTPEAVHRFKLLAGVRWTPPPGAGVNGLLPMSKIDAVEASERDGTFKMSEESFPDGKMNRKWLSDVLSKLVLESNNPTEEILSQSSLLPLDTRHVIAKQQKKKNERTKMRGKVVGGVKGFPESWM